MEEPKDIEEWMSTRHLQEVKDEFKTNAAYLEYDAAMKQRKDSFRLEKGRVTAFLNKSVRKLNAKVNAKVNELYGRTYKYYIRKDKDGKDEELKLTDD